MKLYFRISLFVCGMVVGAFYHHIEGYGTGAVGQGFREASVAQDFQSSSQYSGDTLTWQDRNF